MIETVGIDALPGLDVCLLLLEQAAAPSAKAPMEATVIARLNMCGVPFGWVERG